MIIDYIKVIFKSIYINILIKVKILIFLYETGDTHLLLMTLLCEYRVGYGAQKGLM